MTDRAPGRSAGSSYQRENQRCNNEAAVRRADGAESWCCHSNQGERASPERADQQQSSNYGESAAADRFPVLHCSSSSTTSRTWMADA